MKIFEPGKLSKKKTALVLTGGASKGAFQIGVLKALLPKITPHVIIGTSIGSCNGAMTALGYSPDQMEKIWQKIGHSNLFSYNSKLLYKFLQTDALYKTDKYKQFLLENGMYRQFEDCITPLYVNTTRLQDGKTVFFESGPLIDSVLASSAIPPLFGPHTIHGVKYIDGGIGSYLGLDKVRSLDCKQVIIVNLGAPSHYEKHSQNLLYNTSYALDLVINQSIQKALEDTKDLHVVLIELKRLTHIGLLDFSHTEELIDEGEKEGKLALKKIKL